MLTHAQIKHMAERFLAWKLPDDFSPDGGVVFVPDREAHPSAWPTGTNLLNYTQAYQMIWHLAEGLPSAAPEPEERAPIPDRSALGLHGDEEPERANPVIASLVRDAQEAGGDDAADDAALRIASYISAAERSRREQFAESAKSSLPPALARPNRTNWGLEGLTRAEVDDVLETARLIPLDPFGGFTAPDPKNYRTAAREVVEGFEVAAYREADRGDGSRYGYRYSGHWSTPNWRHPDVKIERLFTEAQLRAALDDVPARLEIKRLRQGIALLANRINTEGSAHAQAIRAVDQMVLDVNKAARDLLAPKQEDGK